MRPGERHCLLHPPHHPCPAPLLPTIPLYNILKSSSHLTKQRAHLGNAGLGLRNGLRPAPGRGVGVPKGLILIRTQS